MLNDYYGGHILVDERAWFRRLTAFAVFLAVVVVLLGAYTRLGEAGLGCPDWPGCYGQLTVPSSSEALEKASEAYPNLPVESAKAWKEMVHRYAAGSLGTLIFALAFMANRAWKKPGDPFWLPILLALLVIGQAALGMWTVTWRLHPLVVMGHLLGGMSIATGLCLWHFRERKPAIPFEVGAFYFWSKIVLAFIIVQIVLGGWTSANYASAVCFDFPTCRGEWWPQGHWGEVFDLFRPIGANYEGGAMSLGARMSLQMLHRYWGFLTYFVVMGWSMALMLATKHDGLKRLGLAMMLLASAQVLLGILNVMLHLPVTIAVMHNGGALVLLVTAVMGVWMLGRSVKVNQDM